jgi:hypothetical protein
MATLLIESWSEERRWAGENSWSLKVFCDRLAMCTDLHGTELKRIARNLMKHEISEIDNVNAEKAEPLIHTLESLGAKVAFKWSQP